MVFEKILNTLNPRQLFLLDALGALLTAVLLGLVLTNLETIFGMPPEVLYNLSFVALGFFIYSLTCFLLKIKNWQPFLRFIAILNLLYCCLTAVLVIQLNSKLTVLGILYFVIEIIIVVVLAIIELKYAAK
jgi:hypothetical protein